MRRIGTGTARIAAVLALLLASLSAGVVQAADQNRSLEGFYVATFRTRISDATRAQLARTGADIIGYEPDNSYIVSATPNEASVARRVPAIVSVTPVPTARKLGVEISNGIRRVDVITSGADLSDGLVRRVDTANQLKTVRLNVDPEELRALAARPDVLFIEPALERFYSEDEKTTQTIAGNIGDDRRSVPGYLEWLDKVNVNGKGITVSIVDTGISESHPDLAGRIATIDYSTPVQESPYDTGGHGTHVAGIVGGSPSESGPIYEDPDGFLYGMGVAPQVTLVNQNYLGLLSDVGGKTRRHVFRKLGRDAYEAGSRVWNASWHTGQGSRAGYLAPVREIDLLTRDVLPKTPGSEEFLFVFSAGNAGASGPTVPKEAKNLIAVGSTQSGRGTHWPQTSDPETISSFSSQGPTKDGRIFPTISAPGGNVISARSIEGTASLACATPVDGFAYYCQISGTSMAAPHVTGSAALIQQWWKREHGGMPSPAMVKALLVNTATDIGIADIPNNFEGWGRITLDEIFDRKSPTTALDQKTTFNTIKDAYSFSVASDGRAPLKVTLGWSDAAATAGAEKTLVNDLDLVVERLVVGPGGTEIVEVYRGNVFANGASKPGGKPDRLNNLENVYLLNPEPGIYRITISTANLPGDGVPNNADETDQDFVLVITGNN